MTMSLTEQSIRRAATKLISRTGYESMSLRQLASEADINSSTLYLYYKGKRELLLTLVLGYFEELSRTWEQCRPLYASADVLLHAFVAFHVRHHLQHREQAVLGNMELRSLDAGELAIVQQARRAYLAKLQEILEQGVGEGSLRGDEPKLLARTIFSMLTDACAWYQADGRLGIDDFIAHYSELVLRMLGSGLPLPARQNSCQESP
ncbi:MAG: TetR/AcrR family transcriptional regulator [Pseudomonas sp.]